MMTLSTLSRCGGYFFISRRFALTRFTAAQD
eukprot:COSAG02_NODE_39757_length_413_cov_0.824841_1_plen_30_part_10